MEVGLDVESARIFEARIVACAEQLNEVVAFVRETFDGEVSRKYVRILANIIGPIGTELLEELAKDIARLRQVEP